MTSSDARRYFAADTNILTPQAPAIVVYPHNETCLVDHARFTWQLADAAGVIPVKRHAALGLTGPAAPLATVLLSSFRPT